MHAEQSPTPVDNLRRLVGLEVATRFVAVVAAGIALFVLVGTGMAKEWVAQRISGVVAPLELPDWPSPRVNDREKARLEDTEKELWNRFGTAARHSQTRRTSRFGLPVSIPSSDWPTTGPVTIVGAQTPTIRHRIPVPNARRSSTRRVPTCVRTPPPATARDAL